MDGSYTEGYNAGMNSVDITSNDETVAADAYEAGRMAGHLAGIASVTFLQSSYDSGFAAGVASVDITTDICRAPAMDGSYDEGFTAGAASVTFLQASYDQGFAAGVSSVDITSDNEAISTTAYNNGFAAGVASVDTSAENSVVTSDDISVTVGESSVFVTVSQDDNTVQTVVAHGLEAAGSEQKGIDSVTVTGIGTLSGNELPITLSSGKANQKVNISSILANANTDGSTTAGLESAVAQANLVEGLSASLSGNAITFTVSAGSSLSYSATDADILGSVEFDAAIETAIDGALDSHSDESDEWKKGFANG